MSTEQYGSPGNEQFLRHAEADGALFGQFRHLHPSIYGNRADCTSGRWGCFFLDRHSRQNPLLSDKTTNTRQIK